MELSDEMLAEISYVNISTYRTKVMKALENEVKIPSIIAKDSGIRTNHISKVLAELKAHELVECINPEVRKGRLYRHTEKGSQIVKNLDKFILTI
ncbi:transcriptional regulator [Methanobrevibacter sp.]|uniref:transcriptional regulator n=1 Tax=Methanobrevibacter sp. TaxID=66852 RepID=UPI002E781E0D|nr:transcriptional regulator [Methanobrevibacter sp.]MEE0938206.1 transcriptional regulator [Methanobrevibacter sp.]